LSVFPFLIRGQEIIFNGFIKKKHGRKGGKIEKRNRKKELNEGRKRWWAQSRFRGVAPTQNKGDKDVCRALYNYYKQKENLDAKRKKLRLEKQKKNEKIGR
jgi:hypothetical protein